MRLLKLRTVLFLKKTLDTRKYSQFNLVAGTSKWKKTTQFSHFWHFVPVKINLDSADSVTLSALNTDSLCSYLKSMVKNGSFIKLMKPLTRHARISSSCWTWFPVPALQTEGKWRNGEWFESGNDTASYVHLPFLGQCNIEKL